MDESTPENVPESQRFFVGAAEARLRLDEFLAGRLGGISRMRLRRAIAEGEVTLNGEATHAGWRVAAGDEVVCRFEELTPTAMTPEPIPLDLLYEDDSLAVVVKPAGMVAHPTPHHRSGTLANALSHRFNRERAPGGPWVRPGLPHRLDGATSGLMVVTKTQQALSRLTIQFGNRQVEKRYLAIAYGVVTADEGVIDAPIGYDPDQRPRWRVLPEGRPSQSRFRTLERRGGFSLLELEPITGRTNQLRIHCAHHGHPIVGDPEFGLDLVAGRYTGVAAAHPPPPRLALHASVLAFMHPVDGRLLRFVSELPVELAEWWGGGVEACVPGAEPPGYTWKPR
jgi:23S rRNA pseudouridine1911/1915/1917 synthase